MTLYDSVEVHVDISGTTLLAGRAQFHRSRGTLTSTTFQYDTTYLENPTAYELDPALRMVSGTQQTRGLPGAFADAAPDRWGRNLIKKRERARARVENRRPREFDDADFLTEVSDQTRQGALRFRATTGDRPEFLSAGHEVPRLIRLPELLRAADAAANTTEADDFEAVKALLAAGTGSLGGARPKSAVLDDTGRQMIAKFPHQHDEWDVMAWEATALDLAEAAGVRVSRRRLIRVEGRHVLLLDRFDRDPARIGYMSAMTVLELHDGDQSDYSDIADRLAEVSAQASADARELFRRVAVSVGLNNTDDHLRNHGFLHGRGGWSLSPAFDVNPNPNAEMRQTAIAGADLPADQAEGLKELARLCRLSQDEARTILSEVAEAIADWRDAARRNDITTAEFGRFEDSFSTGLQSLRSV